MSLYEAMSTNYRQVARALYHIEKSTNRAIRDGDDTAAASLVKVQMLMVSIKAETGFVRVLHLPNGLGVAIRRQILGNGTAVTRWEAAIDESFRRHYKVPRRKSLEATLEHDVLAKRNTLHDLVHHDLSPLIDIRNKLAHGQFVKPLSASLDRVEPGILRALGAENALTLKFRDNLIEQLTKALGDLIESPRTFEQRFNKRYLSIRDNRAALKQADYSEWVASLRKKRRSFPSLAAEYMKKYGVQMTEA